MVQTVWFWTGASGFGDFTLAESNDCGQFNVYGQVGWPEPIKLPVAHPSTISLNVGAQDWQTAIDNVSVLTASLVNRLLLNRTIIR